MNDLNENILSIKCPDLAKEWDYNKNEGVCPEDVTFKSHKKVWWIGKCGHEWQATVKNRTSGTNCPICARSIVANKRIIKYIEKNGSLADHSTQLIKEWHPTKNGDLTPHDITTGSQKKIWWVCKKGHEWQTTVSDRIRGRNCPYCSGRRILVGENDLTTSHPKLVEEWHPTKNGDFLPEMFSYGSNKKIWWQCKRGHEWKTPIVYRTTDNTGCPFCAKELQTSFPEQAILFYIKKCFSEVISNDRILLDGKELDIYIPSCKTAIEYDGEAWHRNEKKDNIKFQMCKSIGVRLIRIREGGCKSLIQKNDVYNCIAGDRAMLNYIIKDICFDIAKIDIDVDVERDSLSIQEQYIISSKESSLAFLYPEIAKEWHPIKNGKLDASMFYSRSGKKVWWRCSQGHEWQSTIINRVNGKGCPFCSGRYAISGINDLETINPILAGEWHPKKNGKIKPSMFLPSSGKKVWWQCKNGHEWQDTINHRSSNRGCPFCSGRKILLGYNDLYTLYPDISKEWHPTKNGNLSPHNVTKGSNIKVWWICSKGHEWETTVNNRTRGSRCPICARTTSSKKRINSLINKNGSLAILYPLLAEEWHPTKNGDLSPYDVTKGSHKKVWWICSKGHEWQAIIKDRTRGGKCPFCKKKV